MDGGLNPCSWQIALIMGDISRPPSWLFLPFHIYLLLPYMERTCCNSPALIRNPLPSRYEGHREWRVFSF
eukprot:scaffold189269_cov27-Tisochrysis_lutea.AAC.2